MRARSKALTREQIDKRFEALKTAASVSGGTQSASISLNTRRGELAEALVVAAEILRNPIFPQDEFEQLRLQAITGMEASRKEPGSIAGDAMGDAFDPWPADHPLRHRDFEESLANLKALSLDDVRAYHRDVYGTAQGEIAIVGDFDPAAIKPLRNNCSPRGRPAWPMRRFPPATPRSPRANRRSKPRTNPARCSWPGTTCRSTTTIPTTPR